jgi:uncharacterized protein (DUF2236 family)
MIQPMLSIIRLPDVIQASLNLAAGNLLRAPGETSVDFAGPRDEGALVPPDSVSWRIFKNPIALFIGGVASVILELAEPSVRAGVWGHSTFRTEPLRRLRRTGLAAMITVYGARSVAEPMIAGIARMHAKVAGTTQDGIAYAANDAGLLTWVHSTASYGFVSAYDRYVRPLGVAAVDAFYTEGAPVSRLYGALNAPESAAQTQRLFDHTHDSLTPSPIIFQFLQIMRDTPAFPGRLQYIQSTLVRAAVDLLPAPIRQRLGLTGGGLRPGERLMVKLAGSLADRIVLAESPAVQSCIRLGLAPSYLYT